MSISTPTSTRIRLKPSAFPRAADVRRPYKLAIVLLYGRVDGVEETSPGMRVVNYALLRKSIGNIASSQIAKDLQACVELGILSYAQHHKTYAVVKLNLPLGMQLNPPSAPVASPMSWEPT